MGNMEVSKIKEALIMQKIIELTGNLYYRTQIEFCYNTNHIEGSTITEDETMSIYDTGTILADSEKIVSLKDMTETKNHFTLFKYMLETCDEDLTENLIKKFHFILKSGTLTDKETATIAVGEYKKLKNYVGNIKTSLPSNVEKDMKNLIESYNSIEQKTFEDIVDFHAKFEAIHPFQDGNGRVRTNDYVQRMFTQQHCSFLY
jgi:Fic family protein